MTAAQAMCPPQPPPSSILLAVFVIRYDNSTAAQPLLSLPTTYHWRFYARETYNGHNKVIGTEDCPLGGCQTRIEIPAARFHLHYTQTFSLLSLLKHR